MQLIIQHLFIIKNLKYIIAFNKIGLFIRYKLIVEVKTLNIINSMNGRVSIRIVKHR